MNMLRFALVVPEFPSALPAPPGENYFFEPGCVARDAGFEVEILCRRRPQEPVMENVQEITVRRYDSLAKLLYAIRSGNFALIHAHTDFRPGLLSGFIAGDARTVL